VPFTSHVAFTAHALGDGVQTPPAFAALPDRWAFMALYAGLCIVMTLVLYLLLARSRRRMAGPRGGAGEAFVS
jgi:hypothetical protein